MFYNQVLFLSQLLMVIIGNSGSEKTKLFCKLEVAGYLNSQK